MSNNIHAIYEDIKSSIINLALVPGTKIKEEDLAKKYNISRTPIRGIITRLVNEGLVEVAPKKGTYVSRFDLSHIHNFIYVRKAVEITTLQKVINTISDEQIKELEDILLRQKEIVNMEPSIEKSRLFFHNDNLFHATIFKFAQLEGVWSIIHTNAILLNRARIMANLRSNPEVEGVYDYHLQMLKHIKNKDEKELIKVFEEHIDKGFSGIDHLVNKYNEYFK